MIGLQSAADRLVCVPVDYVMLRATVKPNYLRPGAFGRGKSGDDAGLRQWITRSCGAGKRRSEVAYGYLGRQHSIGDTASSGSRDERWKEKEMGVAQGLAVRDIKIGPSLALSRGPTSKRQEWQ